jgi:hypothetical protein
MEIQSDFRELLALFSARKVEYVIVGAYALAFHGAPRFTGDLDILVNPHPDNAERVVAALEAFGFTSMGLTISDLSQEDRVIQLGVPPMRIDLITSLSGVSWEQAWENRTVGNFGDVPVNFIGREQFVTNKRATGRKKDLADVEALAETDR